MKVAQLKYFTWNTADNDFSMKCRSVHPKIAIHMIEMLLPHARTHELLAMWQEKFLPRLTIFAKRVALYHVWLLEPGGIHSLAIWFASGWHGIPCLFKFHGNNILQKIKKTVVAERYRWTLLRYQIRNLLQMLLSLTRAVWV